MFWNFFLNEIDPRKYFDRVIFRKSMIVIGLSSIEVDRSKVKSHTFLIFQRGFLIIIVPLYID